jgi:septal ring factor EnvC (AmiA/AmiB activator)
LSEKKVVSRSIATGTALLCVVLLISLVGAVITYSSILDAKDDLIASKDMQIADETSQTSDLEDSADEKQNEIADLNSQITQKDSTITDLNKQINQKNTQISESNSEISQKESTVSDLNHQISEKESMISDLNKEISEKDLTIASLNDQDSLIASLNDEISQKDNQISVLNSQISALTSQIANLNSQLSQKNSTIESLNNQITLLENTTSNLNQEIANLNTQITVLNTQVISLQTENTDLTQQITALNAQLATLQTAYTDYTQAYQNLRAIVNHRIDQSNISDFITPNDPAVTSLVYSITGGWSNPSDPNELWTDLKTMYTWVLTDTNIEYNSDGLNPILPSDPSNEPSYGGDMWQYPNETLSLGYGDCEDQAILLCNMIRCYTNQNYAAHCIWITSATAAHVGVQIPTTGDTLVIFDPAGEYYSEDSWGNIEYNDISLAIDEWFDYWVSMGVFSSDIRVYRVFSDNLDLTFTSTSEYLTWMYS